MREIKFRAWEKRENKMWYADELINSDTFYAVGFHGKLVVVDGGSFKQGDGKTRVTGFNVDHILNLMQYTGLKDKNGREIYEGDIIISKSNSIKSPNTVIFSDGAFGVSNGSFTELESETSFKTKDCEVVGNIYENKELLV